VFSVSSLYPTVGHPHYGVFVQRRLQALSKLADVSVLRPIPWFPFYRHVTPNERSLQNGLVVQDRPMFYLPLVFKQLDSMWLKRCVAPMLRRRQKEGTVDLIDAHFGFPTGVGCVNAAESLGIPVFVTLRGVEQEEMQQPAIARQMTDALKRAAGCIAVSETLRDLVVDRGVPAEKVTVIPNGVDSAVFHPGSRAEARRTLGISTEERLVVSVGNVKPVKQHHVLIEAMARLGIRRAGVRLSIVGATDADSAYTSHLRDLIRRLDVEEHVKLEGGTPPHEVATWLQAADVFSLASRREGCCNAVLEALACGVPVVTTAAGDNERYVDPPQNGVIVPFDDPQAMADAWQAAFERDWDAAAISRAVQSRGWDGAARETFEFFRERLAIFHASSGGRSEVAKLQRV